MISARGLSSPSASNLPLDLYSVGQEGSTGSSQEYNTVYFSVVTFCNLPFGLYHTHARLAYPIYIEQPRAQPRVVSRSLEKNTSDLI